MWTKKDKLLFSIVNHYGNAYLQRNGQQIMKTFQMKQAIADQFGYYDKIHNTFHWLQGINKIIYKLSMTHYFSVFGSKETIRKLCQPTVHIEPPHQYVIPYLVQFLNAAFSVIPFHEGNRTVYGMTRLGIKDSFDFGAFNASMGAYRLYGLEQTKHKKHANVKRRRSSRR
jgi:hypothetical protein